MKNVFKILVILGMLVLPLRAAERFNGQCRTDSGPISNGCTVTVYDAGTVNVSSIFSDTGLGSAKANPFTGDSNGQAFFYAADGNYDVVYSGGTPDGGTFTISSVRLGDNDNGTVTSVAMSAPSEFSISGSPVTTSGTLALTLASQSANIVWAGPTSGGAATPAFRALVDADIPDLDTLASGMANGCVEVVGGVLTSLGSSCGVTSGTVTSVGLSMPSDFSIAGSPLTSSGTLAVTYANQAQNRAFMSPDGATGAPTFRALVADDVPNLATSKITSGTWADARVAESNVTQHEGALTLGNLTGTLGVTKGGTGLTTLALGDIYYGSAANTASKLSGNTSATKNYLTQTGDGAASAAPVWAAIQAADLPSAIDAAKIADGSVSDTEFQYLNGVTSAIQTQLTAKALAATSLTAGVGLSGGGDLSAGRTFTFDATELDDLTWSDGGNATVTHTWDVSGGTNPVWTYTAGVANLSAGALQVGGTAVLTAVADSNLPAEVPLTDEANTFTALQTFPVDGIAFPATGTLPTHSEGRVFYDYDNGALAVYNDESSITLQIGQEMYLRVKNETGGTISEGEAVYIIGNDAGATAAPTVGKADSSSFSTAGVVGIATHDIETATYGYVTLSGLVNGLDTSSWTAGDELWLSTTAGSLTNVRPLAPEIIIPVGYVTRSNASSGAIFVVAHPVADKPHGAVYISTGAGESITAATAELVPGTCTVSGFEVEFTESAECRLRYDGASTRTFQATANLALTSSASNLVAKLYIAKGGTTIAASEIQRKIGTGSDVGAFSTTWQFTLATNQYVEMYLDIDAGTSTMTSVNGTLLVTAID